MPEIDRKTNAILTIIGEAKRPIGSTEIASKLQELGFELSERTVRYYLKNMSEEGLIKIFWKEGRMITSKGREELGNARVSDKVGLMSSRIEAMSYLMDFDLAQRQGTIILNITYIRDKDFPLALKLMRPVFQKKMSMGERVLVAKGGSEIGKIIVPKYKIAFGSLCSINLNGILLRHSLPIESKFGGVLQIDKGKPHRFTELISYSGSTLDPHEIFIKSKMTAVREATSGSGKILAGLREIPAVSHEKAEEIFDRVEQAGLGGVLFIGKPGQPVLGMPVGVERVGIVVAGGLNPIAAVEEAGIETESKALGSLLEYNQLQSFWDLT